MGLPFGGLGFDMDQVFPLIAHDLGSREPFATDQLMCVPLVPAPSSGGSLVPRDVVDVGMGNQQVDLAVSERVDGCP